MKENNLPSFAVSNKSLNESERLNGSNWSLDSMNICPRNTRKPGLRETLQLAIAVALGPQLACTALNSLFKDKEFEPVNAIVEGSTSFSRSVPVGGRSAAWGTPSYNNTCSVNVGSEVTITDVKDFGGEGVWAVIKYEHPQFPCQGSLPYTYVDGR